MGDEGLFPDQAVIEAYRCESVEVERSGKRRVTQRRVLFVRSGDGSPHDVQVFHEGFGRRLAKMVAWRGTCGGGFEKTKDRMKTQIMGGELFSDHMQYIQRVPDGPGTVFAFELRYEEKISGLNADRASLCGAVPLVQWEYHLKVPSGWSVESQLTCGEKLEDFAPSTVVSDREYVWTARDVVAPAHEESWAPPPQASTPVIHVRWFDPQRQDDSRADWNHVGGWYLDFGEDALVATEGIAELAGGFVTECESLACRAKHVADLVQQQIHYVQVYREDGAWRPHRPAEVYASRYGDCKDMSYLMVVLLREAGLDAYPVLTSAGPFDPVHPECPIPSFNHCIVGVSSLGGPSGCLFFDPTCKHVPLGRLAAQLEGRWSLPLEENAIRLQRLPESCSESNQHRIVVNLHLDKDMGGVAECQEVMTGHPAYFTRSRVSGEGTAAFRETIQRRLALSAPRAQLSEFTIDYSDAACESLRVAYAVRYRQVGTRIGEEAFIPVSPHPREPLPPLPPGERLNDVVFPYARVVVTDVLVTWPEEWEVVEIPQDTVFSSDDLVFSLSYRKTQNGVHRSAREEIRKRRIPVARYDDVVQWSHLIDGCDRQRIVLKMRER
ncbi:MAG: transglutaminase domain-containing protein [Candidatus Eisenbacteria sp.]|nr:transglutaminase domain-containing protein [Candidatus Eisenbacteria bacterium]